jgi:hypothetical protein
MKGGWCTNPLGRVIIYILIILYYIMQNNADERSTGTAEFWVVSLP